MKETVYSNNELKKLVIDFFHRISMHHAMWFAETSKKLGHEKAYLILDNVCKQSYTLQMKRLSNVLGFETENGFPESAIHFSDEKNYELCKSIAINWLANDGIWFQAVELSSGMVIAKQCNDSCWEQFSPFEAWSVKRLLGMSENPGIEGLKQALDYRLYAFINKQSVIEESSNSIIFQMNDCRVQSARKRKGLADYPCKSAGIVEYTGFAKAIDPRIKTQCICCPPDNHPENYFCAWKFYIED